MPADYAGMLHSDGLQQDRAPSLPVSQSALPDVSSSAVSSDTGPAKDNTAGRSVSAEAASDIEQRGDSRVATVTVLPGSRAPVPSVRAVTRSPVAADSEQDSARSAASSAGDDQALQILLQASAAAETLQQRFTELQVRRSELAAEQRQLDADRRAFEQHAQDFVSQVARDRTIQREMQLELEQRVARAAEKEEGLDRGLAELRAGQRALSEERVLLKQALRAELDSERAQLEEQRQQLSEARQKVELQREELLQEHAARLEQVEAQLARERQQLVDRVRDDLAAELAQLNREKHEWRSQRDQQKLEIQQQAEDLQQQRDLFGEQLEAEQQRLRDEVEKRRQMLLTEQTNLQRRYRFQFEHLGRAREDLETEVRELRRDQQMLRTDRHRFMELHRLRFAQLKRIRQRMEDLEASLGRELRLIERSRTAALADVQRLQRRALEERAAMSQEIESRRIRVKQQETSLSDLAQRLEERSQRLGRLRAELDKTQGEILEQRLAVEEAKAGLFRDPASSEQARARLEQARSDVQVFFDRVKGQLNAERDKLETASAEILERQAQFRRDRAELEQWFAEREQSLQERTADSVISELHQKLDAQNVQLAEFQERWKADRRDAERTIRDLLDQLAVAEMKAFETPAPAPAPAPVADAA